MPSNPFDAFLYLVGKAILTVATVFAAAAILFAILLAPKRDCGPGYVYDRVNGICVVGFVYGYGHGPDKVPQR